MKKLLTLLLTLTLLLGLSAPALAAGEAYRDVPRSHWAYDEINLMTNLGVVQGVGDRTFSPEGKVTTGEFAAMVIRAFYGEPTGEFSGVSYQAWWSDYMFVAQILGLLDGTLAGDSYWGGSWNAETVNAPMIRYDMAQVMYNTLVALGADLPSTRQYNKAREAIPDYDAIPYAYRSAVVNMYAMGCLAGMDTAGTFMGTSEMTRAQSCRVMQNLFTAVESPEEPTPTPTPTPPETPDYVMPNGQPLTDDNIRSVIYGLKSQYPEGMPWTNEDGYRSDGTHIMGFGCAAFALICSDAVFGDLPISEEHSRFDDIRVGDMLRINNDTHSVVVLEKRANSVIVTEGNYNSSIHWGREISRQSLENGNFCVQSRYPQ